MQNTLLKALLPFLRRWLRPRRGSSENFEIKVEGRIHDLGDKKDHEGRKALWDYLTLFTIRIQVKKMASVHK